jgi:hypothetical protein
LQAQRLEFKPQYHLPTPPKKEILSYDTKMNIENTVLSEITQVPGKI